MTSNPHRHPRARPLIGLVLAAALTGCGADYDVARRTAADPDRVPADDACRFELARPVLPVSRASWLTNLTIVEKRHWPEGLYADYLAHRQQVAAMGRRAPAWPSKRVDGYRFEWFRNGAQAHAVRFDDRIIYFVTRLTRRKPADESHRAGGYHDVAMLPIGGKLQERVILHNIEGGRPDAPLEFQVQAFAGVLFLVYGTTDAIMLTMAQLVGNDWRFSEPRVLHALTAPPCDLRLAKGHDRLHLVWTADRRVDPAGGVLYSSTSGPARNWSTPILISPTSLNGTADVVPDGNDVFVVWTDDQAGEGSPRLRDGLGWVYVAGSRDGGATFGRPVLVSDAREQTTQARLVLLAPMGKDLALYWSAAEGDRWPDSWNKAALDRDLDVVRPAGTVTGSALVSAYRKRMIALLEGAEAVTAAPTGP